MKTADAVAIFVGIILGSGVFVAPAQVIAAAPSIGGALAIWALGAIVAACGAFTYAELGARFPQNGGFYVYYQAVFGSAPAFIGGWSALLVTYPASTAAIALLGASYIKAIVPAAGPYVPWVATAALVLAGALNWAGVRSGATAQRVLTAFKVVAVLAVCLAALFASGSPTRGATTMPVSSLAFVLTAVVSVLWSYDGWSDVTLVTGELVAPERNLGRAVAVGVLVLFAVYSLVQLAVMSLLPLSVAAGSSSVLADAVQASLGAKASGLIAAIVVVSTFGSVNGIMLTSSRLAQAMSRDRVIPSWFAGDLGTPKRAIAAMVLATTAYVWLSDFRGLLEFFGQTIWLFYGLTACGLVRLRWRGDVVNAFRAPVGAPYVVIAVALAMTIGLAIADVRRFFTGVVFVGSAAPTYLLWRYVMKRVPPSS
ncbi:MAG: amino acid permease [Clostridia bacterium]|nr:amino acid permease [Deltaproteobacteria bacterium]